MICGVGTGAGGPRGSRSGRPPLGEGRWQPGTSGGSRQGLWCLLCSRVPGPPLEDGPSPVPKHPQSSGGGSGSGRSSSGSSVELSTCAERPQAASGQGPHCDTNVRASFLPQVTWSIFGFLEVLTLPPSWWPLCNTAGCERHGKQRHLGEEGMGTWCTAGGTRQWPLSH